MGLAAEKKRIKLSHDPNNTKWTNDSTSFGLKMMTAQGWQPGQYLGAKDAAHAEFHTAANSSHIRVSIKDDNLGLGAKTGTGVGHGECTGLDAFKNLLGRLNGKEESEIAKEQKSRDDLRRAIYSERKWGTQRFISGGFLIGDKIQILIDAEAERVRKLPLRGSDDSASSSSESEEETAPVVKSKKTKKRKAVVLEEAGPEVVAFKVKKSNKERSKGHSVEDSAIFDEEKESKKPTKYKKDRKPNADTEDSEEESGIKERKEKKDKKRKKRKERAGSEAEAAETEKERKKREKRAKREKKAAEDAPEVSKPSSPMTRESAPVAAPSRATAMLQGRHAVRSRFIKQKKLASMDPASLAQIFMIKSQ
ncbi:hypothetical protein QTJ16_002958 [Diplocarpon rosae]|uniref:PinX1-related protein 1 n=1 Tax=Diplocarpon rosae TaxID=946125 RepID=A0AAD9T433_9HELO|nr:hypothetical protein QTJ16_002958 [Diplocarpon rosae]PBP22892.1 putative Protein PXR1 [Diplocarpon rosae]